jgi:two-component system chemotaxis sensor kinase CheA
MLLFRAGDHGRLAVPLGLVARLEDFPREEIEFSDGSPVVQYRGKLMKLVPFSGIVDSERARQPVLVFTDGGRSMGLMVDGITDVVEDRLHIELSGARPGLLGTAVIDGQATDVIDTGFWLQQAGQDWFQGTQAQAQRRRRILMVDDNSFFRQLLVPTLSAAGYQVTAVESAADALALRDGGAMFDVIVSDIDMPGMDGLSFARAVRAAGPWAALPLIALSAAAEAADVAAGLDAGFTDYIAKSQRESLLASLAQGNGAIGNAAMGIAQGLAA